ncbi:hypothetical protein HPT25_23480 [Bacillus sp. BRMEA1]|uniref:hypothetical protein n=1 Tax=Neobacillus endophyticus TaxID=2738405 RepID=UPI001563AE71|nr:hypothetical protein [Neobacillus endophyticus]NRD80288.1 hypothetical protein [Neobacillus endophyticus]
MDGRAQEIIDQISALSGSFGVTVIYSRIVVTDSTPRNAFGTPIDASGNPLVPQSFTANVIIESQKIDETPTLAGGKAKELLKLITSAGIFLAGDELKYGSHTYKVNFIEPVPFVGTDVVNFVHAAREVD